MLWGVDWKHAMQERRKEQRTRALKTARIVYNNRFSVLDCAVRNLSSHGAQVLVQSPHGIPDTFQLELDAGASIRDCKVIWRQERKIGVEFV
jgi:hypothetical protein